MQAAKQIRLSRNAFSVRSGFQPVQVAEGVDPLEAELGLAADGGDVLHRGERLDPVALLRQVGVQQVQVELHVHGFLEQLPGQVQACFGGVDVLVQVEHQVVGDDGVAGGEERDQPVDQVPFGGGQLAEVGQVGVQVDFLDRPGVLDRVLEPVEELRVPHRTQGEVQARSSRRWAERFSAVVCPVRSMVTGRPHRIRGSPASRRALRRPARWSR